VALSRDEVITGALALLDDVGLDALTMRRLAQALGVHAGAIYWHFSDRQDLEDAMVDAMLAGLLEPPLTGPWDRQVAELCRRLAAALLSRRDGARLAVRALRPGPNSLKLSEALLATLSKGRRSQRATIWAAAVVGYYILGYVTDLQATEAAKVSGLVSIARSVTRRLDRKRYPHLAKIGGRALTELVAGRNAHARFEFGLDVILKGLSAATPRPRRPPRGRTQQ
jgi:TetR/AcrR family transcriptional regulator, tetracycline repressor protein